jgi:hypothetical protein
MTGIRKFVLLFFLLVCPISLMAAPQEAPSTDQSNSLGNLARGIRAQRETQSGPTTTLQLEGKESKNGVAQSTPTLEPGNFADIEAAANSARMSKERGPGGAWKLYLFYDNIKHPREGDDAPDDQWARHIAMLEKWVSSRPESITARVALAEAYRGRAWKIRGSGYADTVTADRWREFKTQINKAFKTLSEAEKLPAKCPHWYFVMLEVARDQDWDKAQTRALFERAIAFEPGYYHYYREYAYNLLPKNSGAPGEVEAFAEESYRRLSAPQNAFVYFEIATVIYCMCYDDTVRPTLSWSKIKDGYAALEANYGTTMLKLNRYAVLAYLYRDTEAAGRTFARIGDQWEPTIWRKRETFDRVQSWARLPVI